jgi:hypothetical protein
LSPNRRCTQRSSRRPTIVGAEKADASENPLYHAAGGIGNFCKIARGIGQDDNHCGRKTHQAKRLQADRLAVQIAIKPDQIARISLPQSPGYFGTRPIM